jgi:ABC-type uncharacterized transport system substrate-binding protein
MRRREFITLPAARPLRGVLSSKEKLNEGDVTSRRRFITGLGTTLLGWSAIARAQQGEQLRRIGVLMTQTPDDFEGQARLRAFLGGLEQLGWTDGRNLRIETRWTGGDAERIRGSAAELTTLAPNVILAVGGATVERLLQVTRTVPVVFVAVPDPVGAGFVDDLARPGRNATGFSLYDFSLSGKWMELLKEIAPDATRVGVLRDSAISSGPAQFAVIQAVAPSVGAEVRPLNVQDADQIDRDIIGFARSPNAGLIVTGSALVFFHRDLIVTLAARHKLPAVYPNRVFVTAGGLISYGTNIVNQFRRAANYVDRILKGEKPADLPVQAPTEYELVINLKTAKALGLAVPSTMLARAYEVIE